MELPEIKSPPRRNRAMAARFFGAAVTRLQEERIRRDWTQRELGALVGALLGRAPYTGGYIHRIEIGEYPPPAPIAEALCKLFGIGLAELESWLESRETAA